jgi:hypothetical protein
MNCLTSISFVLALSCLLPQLHAEDGLAAQRKPTNPTPGATPRATDDDVKDIMSADEWRRVDSSVDRALSFLISQQEQDGRFPSYDNAQPAVTSLCLLAFMAHGHTPGHGIYGERLERALKFIISCQKKNGLLMLVGPDEPQISRGVDHMIGALGSYDHAISSLTLAELYGMNQPRNAQLQKVIDRAIVATIEMQNWPKHMPEDRGGWRYINNFDESDSDLSLTGWHLMFLRSARNAGFDVREEAIKNAVAYIRRTFNDQYGTFTYTIKRGDTRSRGMTGAGILALGHAGFHNSAEAKRAAEALMSYDFDAYNGRGPFPQNDRYHYSLFMCCQGAYQMGSPYWERFFPHVARSVVAHQRGDGSWALESFSRDQKYGNSYTTAMVILTLGAPNQLLPIFQR